MKLFAYAVTSWQKAVHISFIQGLETPNTGCGRSNRTERYTKISVGLITFAAPGIIAKGAHQVVKQSYVLNANFCNYEKDS